MIVDQLSHVDYVTTSAHSSQGEVNLSCTSLKSNDETRVPDRLFDTINLEPKSNSNMLTPNKKASLLTC